MISNIETTQDQQAALDGIDAYMGLLDEDKANGKDDEQL